MATNALSRTTPHRPATPSQHMRASWQTQPLAIAARPTIPLPTTQRQTHSMRHSALPVLLTVALALFAILNIADLASTFIGLQHGLREGNPLMSGLLMRFGFGALIAYKFAVIALVSGGVYILHAYHARISLLTITICNALVFAVVLLNLVQFAAQR